MASKRPEAWHYKRTYRVLTWLDSNIVKHRWAWLCLACARVYWSVGRRV